MSSLRDQIESAIRDARCHHEGADYHPACPDCLADPIEDIFDAGLAAKDAEIERLTEERDLARKTRDEHANRLEVAERMRPDDYYQQLDEIRGSIADERVAHAEREHALMAAEAERDQLRYERRLLGFARATLDLVAAGDESRWPQARREAEDIAQRIVDEIGHPVTDEPALGPSLRAELKQAEAAIERVRGQLGRGLFHTSECLGRPAGENPNCTMCGIIRDLDEPEETP